MKDDDVLDALDATLAAARELEGMPPPRRPHFRHVHTEPTGALWLEPEMTAALEVDGVYRVPFDDPVRASTTDASRFPRGRLWTPGL